MQVPADPQAKQWVAHGLLEGRLDAPLLVQRDSCMGIVQFARRQRP